MNNYPTSDYDEELGYDANHNDPSQFCRHGTFIGSWWGPDYMCGYCESGEEPPTQAELDEALVARALQQIDKFEKLMASLRGSLGYRADLATWAANDVLGHGISMFRDAEQAIERGLI